MSKRHAISASSLALLVLFVMSPLHAADVTGLTTFVPNTPALAEEVNGNFDAVKSAVDDNDQRITDVEAKLPDGAVSFSAYAFSEWTNSNNPSSTCQWARLGSYGYFDLYWAQSVGCKVTTPVHLPQGATVTGMSCLVEDEIYGTTADTYFGGASLRRKSLTTGALDVPYRIATSSTSTGLQSITGAPNTPNELDRVIDNTQYAYTLMVDMVYADDVAAAVSGNNLLLHACNVSYSLP